MTRRTRLLRMLALCWAVLQMASPALGAFAEARLASASAREPVAHVESSSSASCPVVHSPECAMCRYLSSPAAASHTAPSLAVLSHGGDARVEDRSATPNAALVLPDGRAPPNV